MSDKTNGFVDLRKELLNLKANWPGQDEEELSDSLPVGTSLNDAWRVWEQVAFHEAGHAVASLRFGEAPQFVTIAPHGNTLGQTCHVESIAESAKQIEEEIINCYAGQVAERKKGHEDGLGWEQDNQQARLLLEKIDSSEEEMLRKTELFVDSAWLLIQDIAMDLKCYTTLIGPELEIKQEIEQGEAKEEDLEDFRRGPFFPEELGSYNQLGLPRTDHKDFVYGFKWKPEDDGENLYKPPLGYQFMPKTKDDMRFTIIFITVCILLVALVNLQGC